MSDILRLIAGGLLALICCYLGVLVKRRYADREKFFSCICDFCSVFKSDIGYVKKPLPQVINDFCSGRKGECETLLADFVSEMKTKNAFYRDVEKWDIAHLNIAEKKLVLSFLCGLGKTSMDEQLSYVTKAENEFGELKKKCVEENKKQGSMYFKLLVLLGLSILVILA